MGYNVCIKKIFSKIVIDIRFKVWDMCIIFYVLVNNMKIVIIIWLINGYYIYFFRDNVMILFKIYYIDNCGVMEIMKNCKILYRYYW